MSNRSSTRRGGQETRFRKGISGNPKGRPQARPESHGSAFDIVIYRRVPSRQDGVETTPTMEEALQFKTFEAGLAGDRVAETEVLKMIEIREKALAKQALRHPKIEPLKMTFDADNNHDALLLLNIAVLDQRYDDKDLPDTCRRLQLQPWAVQAALNRPRLGKLQRQDLANINSQTVDPETLVWPKRVRDD